MPTAAGRRPGPRSRNWCTTCTRRYRGAVSAEHGIGLLKRKVLGHTRSPAELAAMRAVKQALDPKGILNPGKLI